MSQISKKKIKDKGLATVTEKVDFPEAYSRLTRGCRAQDWRLIEDQAFIEKLINKQGIKRQKVTYIQTLIIE